MKERELASRNHPGGYWVAAATAAAAEQAIVGSIRGSNAAALLTDGAARTVTMFGLMTWAELMTEIGEHGPDNLLRQLRRAEAADPLGVRWPRNKRSDDASIAYTRIPSSRQL
jgi:hypothetical protein